MYLVIRNIKLKGKLIILYLVTIFIPLVIVMEIIVNISSIKVINQTTKITQESSKQISRNIQDLMKQYANISDSICYFNPLLKKMLSPNTKYNDVIASIDAYRDYLQNFSMLDFGTNNQHVILKIYFLNETLLQDRNTFFYVDDDVKQMIEYKKAVDADGALTWGFDKKTGKVFLSRIMKDDDLSNIGVVSIEIPESKFYSLLNETSSSEKLIMIADNEGTIVSSNNRSLLGNTLQDKSFFYQYENKRNAIFDFKEDGSYKVIMDTFSENDSIPQWKVVTMIPLDRLLNEGNKIKFTGFLICMACLMFSCIVFITVLDRITDRIKKLVSKMQGVKEGQFSTIEEIPNSDEIGIMAHNYNLMVEGLQRLIHENYESNIQMQEIMIKKREAELYALQSQIKPHFLFNTLESIRMKLHNGSDSAEISSMVLNLSIILRKSLDWKGDIILLSEELELLRCYLQIQKSRYKDKLDFTLAISPEISDLKIPKLILQPLVENAVKHGIERKIQQGMIGINGHISEEKLVLVVEDDGVGMDGETLTKIINELKEPGFLKKTGSLGFKNINDRIKLYYGNAYGIQIESTLSKGTKVTVTLPVIQ